MGRLHVTQFRFFFCPNAALSAAAAIPFAGWAATGAKFVNKGGKALDAMSTAAKLCG